MINKWKRATRRRTHDTGKAAEGESEDWGDECLRQSPIYERILGLGGGVRQFAGDLRLTEYTRTEMVLEGSGRCHMRICEADLDIVPVRWFVQRDGINDSAES